MSKATLVASAIVLSVAIAGVGYAQAPNLQPKANTNQDIVQTQIQALQKELNELKQQVAESNKRDARSAAIVASLQQQVGALKKAFNEHTHVVPIGDQGSPMDFVYSSALFVGGVAGTGELKAKSGLVVPFVTSKQPNIPWATQKTKSQVQ